MVVLVVVWVRWCGVGNPVTDSQILLGRRSSREPGLELGESIGVPAAACALPGVDVCVDDGVDKDTGLVTGLLCNGGQSPRVRGEVDGATKGDIAGPLLELEVQSVALDVEYEGVVTRRQR